MNTPTTLPKLRHPLIVQTAGPYYAPAVDYEPPAQLVPDSLKELQWGYQEATPAHAKLGNRFMVYDAMGRNVLSTGPTPELAASQAHARLVYEAMPPEQYSPRLKGCKFGVLENNPSNIVQHTVIDENGLVVGVADYRSQACAMAARTLMLKNNVLDMSYEEFCQTHLVVSASLHNAPKRLGGEKRGVFSGGDHERNAIRSALGQIWKISSTGHAQYPTAKQFVDACESEMLRVIGKSQADIFVYKCNFDNLKLRVVFNLPSGRNSNEACLRSLYDTYCKESAAKLLQAQKSNDSDAFEPQGEAAQMYARPRG
jgi:hypothetical protein